MAISENRPGVVNLSVREMIDQLRTSSCTRDIKAAEKILMGEAIDGNVSLVRELMLLAPHLSKQMKDRIYQTAEHNYPLRIKALEQRVAELVKGQIK